MSGAARKPWSISTRLFLSAIVCSVLLLLIAGVVLSTVYRRASEQAFDQQLGVYLRAIVADVALAPTFPNRLEFTRVEMARTQSSLYLSYATFGLNAVGFGFLLYAVLRKKPPVTQPAVT